MMKNKTYIKRIWLAVTIVLGYVANLSAQIKTPEMLSLQECREIALSGDTTDLRQFDGLFKSKDWFILESPTLRAPSTGVIPASEWAFYAEDSGTYKRISNHKISDYPSVTLCWMGCRDSAETDGCGKLLRKKYGSLKTKRGELAVPAQWVSDTLYVAAFPSCQAGLWIVEHSYPEWVVEKGIVRSAPLEESRGSRKPTLRTLVMDLRPDLFQVLDGGERIRRRIEQMEMTLLAYEVNRNLPESPVCTDDFSPLLMVFETEDGSLDFGLLSPGTLTPDQETLIHGLRAAFNKVDNLHIPTGRTLQGRTVPGLLLRAYKDTPRWRFAYVK